MSPEPSGSGSAPWARDVRPAGERGNGDFLTEKSTLVCSGILDVRLPDVLAALEKAGLTVTGIKEKEDWRCVAARK